MNIVLEKDDRGGRYVAEVEGHDETAELTYTCRGDATRIADHTGVPDALRGRGIGQALVRRLVDDARDQNFVIVARCSFVRAQLKRHPEWSDVMRPG